MMKKKKTGIDRGTLVLSVISSVIISVMINLTIKLLPVFEKGPGVLVMDWGIFKPSFMIKTTLVTLDILVILYLLRRIARKRSSSAADPGEYSGQTAGSKTVFVRAFFMCIAVWSFWFVLFFPGASMNDVINGLRFPAQDGNMQPFLYQAYNYYVFALGKRVFHGNRTMAFALLTGLQIIFCAFCVSFNTVWLYQRSLLSGKWTVLYPLYFCMMPIIADYSITIVKDVPFSFALLLFIPLLYEAMEKHTKPKWFLLAVSAFILWFSRSNGKYIIIIALIAAVAVSGRNIRKYLCLLALMFLIDKGATAVQVSLNPWDTFLRESTSVILNQISAVVATGGDISPEDKEFISNIVPYEKWGELYRPSNLDSLKYTGFFNTAYLNQHKTEYLKAWTRIVRDNPEVCVKAYVIQTYGLWAFMFEHPKNLALSQSVFTKINNNFGEETVWYQWMREQNLFNTNILPEKINQKLQQFCYECCKTNITVRPGVFLIAMILLMNMASAAEPGKRKRLRIVFMILFLIWATQMAAIPVSTIYRYSFYMILTLPMMVLLSVPGLRKEIADGGEKKTDG